MKQLRFEPRHPFATRFDGANVRDVGRTKASNLKISRHGGVCGRFSVRRAALRLGVDADGSASSII